MRVNGNPDRDAHIRLALNCGLDQDNPIRVLARDQEIDQSCAWARVSPFDRPICLPHIPSGT